MLCIRVFARLALYEFIHLEEFVMTAHRLATTPIASTVSQALTRVVDLVPRGYVFATQGECLASKAEALAQKFHARYGIGLSPAQRTLRRQRGQANAMLVMYWPGRVKQQEHGTSAEVATSDAVTETQAEERVRWLLLVTEGAGPVREREQLRDLRQDRLVWLGYELLRSGAKASWTFRRTKAEMEALHALIADQLNRKQYPALAATLQRIARQPGFAGVRKQSWSLFHAARTKGWSGEWPHLYFIQKVGHGALMAVGEG